MRQNYIDYQEYLAFTVALEPLEEVEFNRLRKAAENAIDGITNGFYRFHSLDDNSSLNFSFDWEPGFTTFEEVTPRAIFFKKAVVGLIDYYNYQGGVNSYQFNEFQTVQIGRTSLSKGSGNNGKSKGIYANFPFEVIQLLNLGGFLYRGVVTSCL